MYSNDLTVGWVRRRRTTVVVTRLSRVVCRVASRVWFVVLVRVFGCLRRGVGS